MSVEKPFTKENLDRYLRELAKEFRKRNGTKMPAEIILIGGAAVLARYGFREMTYDMDAIIHSSEAMRDAITAVGDREGLPHGWLNTDFMRTASYTTKLEGYSKYYKTFSNILQIRTIFAEYLVAMKLMAGRQYKHDLSDVVGIMMEQLERGDALTFERIRKAVEELYGEYERIPEYSRTFIEAVFEKEDLKSFYDQCKTMEQENKEILIDFQNNYPGVLNGDNLAEIIKAAREKKSGF